MKHVSSHRRTGIGLLLLALLLNAAALHARSADAASRLSVSLLTVGPGPAVYEMYGHNMIGVRLDEQGVAYNYGIFDLGEQGFVFEFMRGRMYYRMMGDDLARTIDQYEAENRTLWQQSLRLLPEQRLALARYLDWNQQPQNQRYRYDYYVENCSTKVRDALDKVVGGEIKRQLQGVPTGRTYRWHTRRMTQINPLVSAGIDFCLGPYADRPLDAWEECFLPDRFMDYARRVQVPNADGQLVSLVEHERVLYTTTRLPTPTAPPNWMPYFVACGGVVGAALAGLAQWSKGGGAGRYGLAIASVLWLVPVAGGGILLLVSWIATTHVATHRNENLLQCNPLVAPLAVLVPLLAFNRTRRWRLAMTLALVAVASSMLGLVLKVFPLFHQANGWIMALMLPANLGLAACVYLLRPRSLDSRPSERR